MTCARTESTNVYRAVWLVRRSFMERKRPKAVIAFVSSIISVVQTKCAENRRREFGPSNNLFAFSNLFAVLPSSFFLSCYRFRKILRFSWRSLISVRQCVCFVALIDGYTMRHKRKKKSVLFSKWNRFVVYGCFVVAFEQPTTVGFVPFAFGKYAIFDRNRLNGKHFRIFSTEQVFSSTFFPFAKSHIEWNYSLL